MASSWLFRPLPLRERVGRGVAPVSSTLRPRRLVVPSPPHPNPLPRGERQPKVPSAKGVIANSTVLALSLRVGRADLFRATTRSVRENRAISWRSHLHRRG